MNKEPCQYPPEEDAPIWRNECESYLDMLISASTQAPRTDKDQKEEDSKKFFCIYQNDPRATEQIQSLKDYQSFHYGILRKEYKKSKNGGEFKKEHVLTKSECKKPDKVQTKAYFVPKSQNLEKYNNGAASVQPVPAKMKLTYC